MEFPSSGGASAGASTAPVGCSAICRGASWTAGTSRVPAGTSGLPGAASPTWSSCLSSTGPRVAWSLSAGESGCGVGGCRAGRGPRFGAVASLAESSVGVGLLGRTSSGLRCSSGDANGLSRGDDPASLGSCLVQSRRSQFPRVRRTSLSTSSGSRFSNRYLRHAGGLLVVGEPLPCLAHRGCSLVGANRSNARCAGKNWDGERKSMAGTDIAATPGRQRVPALQDWK